MNETDTKLRLHGADLLRGKQHLAELPIMAHTWQHTRGQDQARDTNVVAMAMLTTREPW